jgi:hypothetical protein
MEKLFSVPAYKRFAIDDHKRLPSRFFVRISGGFTSGRAA